MLRELTLVYRENLEARDEPLRWPELGLRPGRVTGCTPGEEETTMTDTIRALLAPHPDAAPAFGAPGRDWLTYGGLLEGSVLTETIFSWPGLGRYLATAFLTLDLNAVVGGTMLVALTFSLANLAVDLIYAFLNPKITYTEK